VARTWIYSIFYDAWQNTFQPPLPKQSETPLEMILADIRRAIRTRSYYPALVVALTIPEICVSLTLDRDEFVKEKHYVAWVEKYCRLGQPGIGMPAIDCFRLRGGLIHRANFAGHPFASHHELVLSVRRPGMHATMITKGKVTTAYVGLHEFCDEMARAALRWLEEHRADPIALRNMESLIRYRPEGVLSFMGEYRIKPAIA
jgi:hypothetical protein